MRFHSCVSRGKGILDLINSDVFGAIPIPSLRGSMYCVSYIDDFSRSTWLYFLKKKFKVFGKLKEFNDLVKTKQERK